MVNKVDGSETPKRDVSDGVSIPIVLVFALYAVLKTYVGRKRETLTSPEEPTVLVDSAKTKVLRTVRMDIVYSDTLVNLGRVEGVVSG